MKGRTSFADRVRPKTLTVVGSGITGIMTAWEANQTGYAVTVISQSPDPRSVHGNDNPQLSSTFDSKNDQRYITIFEGHPYLELAGYVDAMYPQIAEDFTKHVLEGGLLVVPFERFREESRRWLEERLEINRALQRGEPATIEAVTALFGNYARENRAAMEKWYGFLQTLLADTPSLLASLSLSHTGIIRLYDSEGAFSIAESSHRAEGVFKRSLTTRELAEEYPAYAEGVRNGFIQGGAIEMHGLTLGVKALGKAMITMLENRGVAFHFNTQAETLVVDGGVVQGIKLSGREALHCSTHYMVHPGAFANPGLFSQMPEIHTQIAAMEGYWITIQNANLLVQHMGNKPNKVHGKQSLSTLLARLPDASRQDYTKRFLALDVNEASFPAISPIVDFNNMPLHEGEDISLGVGSGYVFKGLAYEDERGKPVFTNDTRSEQFVLTVMELWLEALHGKALLHSGVFQVWPVGCKRSWTVDDKEKDVNYPTKDGGVCGIRGGGNTGDTTKSTFIAAYNSALMRKVDAEKIVSQSTLNACASDLRETLRKAAEDIPPNWETLAHALDNIVTRARILNAFQYSGEQGTKRSQGVA